MPTRFEDPIEVPTAVLDGLEWLGSRNILVNTKKAYSGGLCPLSNPKPKF